MRFRNEFYFLSNMFPAAVTMDVNGRPMTFSCVEAAFQAFKCPERAGEFTGIDGFAAKKLGRKVALRPDWEAIKIGVMESAVRAKFEKNPGLMKKLKAVKGEIVEDNTWGDRFWGRCEGTGRNELGKILMTIRDGE